MPRAFRMRTASSVGASPVMPFVPAERITTSRPARRACSSNRYPISTDLDRLWVHRARTRIGEAMFRVLPPARQNPTRGDRYRPAPTARERRWARRRAGEPSGRTVEVAHWPGERGPVVEDPVVASGGGGGRA